MGSSASTEGSLFRFTLTFRAQYPSHQVKRTAISASRQSQSPSEPRDRAEILHRVRVAISVDPCRAGSGLLSALRTPLSLRSSRSCTRSAHGRRSYHLLGPFAFHSYHRLVLTWTLSIRVRPTPSKEHQNARLSGNANSYRQSFLSGRRPVCQTKAAMDSDSSAICAALRSARRKIGSGWPLNSTE